MKPDNSLSILEALSLAIVLILIAGFIFAGIWVILVHPEMVMIPMMSIDSMPLI